MLRPELFIGIAEALNSHWERKTFTQWLITTDVNLYLILINVLFFVDRSEVPGSYVRESGKGVSAG